MEGRTVHLDAALPLVLLLEVCARRLVRLLPDVLRRGRGRGGRAPCGRQEVDVEVRAERERRGLVLVRAVRGVREQLDDRQRQVVGRGQDVRCSGESTVSMRWRRDGRGKDGNAIANVRPGGANSEHRRLPPRCCIHCHHDRLSRLYVCARLGSALRQGDMCHDDTGG